MTEAEFMPFWNLLCEAKNRVPSAPLTRIYAVIVKAEGITAQQWAAACTAAIRFNEFMPTPQALVDLALGSNFGGLALSAWDEALAAITDNRRSLLNDAARKLMNSATNGVALGHVETKQIAWVKKEFLERYTAHLSSEATTRTPSLLAPVQLKELTYDAAD